MLKYTGGDEELLSLFWDMVLREGFPYHGTWRPDTPWTFRRMVKASGLKARWVMESGNNGKVSESLTVLSAPGHRDAVTYVAAYGGPPARLEVAAVSRREAAWYVRRLTRHAPGFPPPKPVPDDRIAVDFSYLSPGGADFFRREITAPSWEKIVGNYPAEVAGRLGSLVAASPSDLPGRIGVLHGAPGTGKTTFLRALAHDWKGKVSLTYVTDAENFFGDTGYMMSVVMHSRERWNMIFCEDAEQFIAPRSHDSGQALSRLLNLGDGMLGQGLQLVMLFTTNMQSDELDPAITRPGRCFLNEKVGEFSASEAEKWLRERGCDLPVPGTLSLARMYEMLRGHQLENGAEGGNRGE